MYFDMISYMRKWASGAKNNILSRRQSLKDPVFNQRLRSNQDADFPTFGNAAAIGFIFLF